MEGRNLKISSLGGSRVDFKEIYNIEDREERQKQINCYVERKFNIFSYLCVIVFKILWTIAFIAVSYGVFQECHLEHHVWIVSNIFNGMFGGILLVYPLMIIINHDAAETFDHWLSYMFLFFCLSSITLLISPLIGKGFI
jgi:hypothetical protein